MAAVAVAVAATAACAAASAAARSRSIKKNDGTAIFVAVMVQATTDELPAARVDLKP